MPFDPAQLELQIGEATPAEARVYVRSPRSPDAPAASLTGHVHGPICDYARTLPARIPLIDQGQDHPLALAIVPDPCFWTPALPMRYEAIVDVASSTGMTTHVLPFGIRPLFRRGKRLLLEGRTWTLRGVAAATTPQSPLDDWHAAGAAMLLAHPAEELCAAADRRGVLLVADARSASPAETVAEVRRLARHPSVGFIVLPVESEYSIDPQNLAAGALLCQWIDPRMAAGPMTLEPWADVAIVDASDLAAASAAAVACPLPVIAVRLLPQATDVDQARRSCDALQADLAGRGEFAGYVV